MFIHSALFKASSIPDATSCCTVVANVELTFAPPVYVVAEKPNVALALLDGAFIKIVELAPNAEVSRMRTKLLPLLVTTEAVAPVRLERFETTVAADTV